MSSAISSRRPRYSVVIVTYNSRENIRVCLESLRRCGRIAERGRIAECGRMAGPGDDADGLHEIIVVDNDSRDGTQAYLRAQDDIRAILNAGNNGFSKGCNQGAAVATGDFIVFLNPDTLVTPGWTGTMARHFRDPSVGAVGPVSNYVAGLQRLDMNLPPAWRDAKSFPGDGAVEVAENLARILKEGNAGKGVITRLLIGFCLMMERARYLAMGGMDENLFLGNDDLDLSWRLRNLGLKLVVASDVFIFHEGQKSFRTEAKSHVDRLTQESTDALYVKLVEHYGGRDKVPSALELWGIGWFSPSPSLLTGPLPVAGEKRGAGDGSPLSGAPRTLKGLTMDSQHGLRIKQDAQPKAPTETRELNAWQSLSVVVYLGNDADMAGGGTEAAPSDAASRLERTVATLPAKSGLDILILNCGSAASLPAPEAPAGAALRKFDFGTRFPARQAMEMALSLAQGSHILFCMAGVESSAMFNHWLDKRDLNALGDALPLPLRIGDGESTCPAYAFLCRKGRLQEALGALPAGAGVDTAPASSNRTARFFNDLGDGIRTAAAVPAGTKLIDPPWLMVRAADLPPMESWTAVKRAAPAAAAAATATTSIAAIASHASGAPGNADPLALYPESLRAAMRGAKSIGFAGANAEIPPTDGPFRVFDVNGDFSPLSGHDLLILRVTPEMIDGLTARLANIRRRAPELKRLIAVFDGSRARGIAATSPLAPVDLTSDGIRSALWGAGFAVSGQQPYSGFPEGAAQAENLRGWIQTDAVPRSAAHRTEKLVSIVILGFNQVEYTKKCIESIRRHTRQKYELILVDNGSKDGTEEFFRSIQGAKVIRNAENLGVSKGWNQGMRLAAGEYILILNNDIIVGPDWLENMVRLAESDPSIGLVGPRSNYIAGPQIVPDVPYRQESEIQAFIRQWQEEHSLSAAEFGFIKGFCHLIPRRVFAKVGFYDERFGKGNFEDDDYCLRVRYHGFRALFSDDVFIHHYGSVSFNQESVDWRALMIENQKKYEQKWAKGAAAVNDTQVGAPPSPASAKLEEGRRAFENGDTNRARALFLEAQGIDASDPETYCCLGVLSFASGALPEAVSLFMGCLNMDPAHEDAARNLLDTLAARNGGVSLSEAASLRSRYPSNRVFEAAAAEAAAADYADSKAEDAAAAMASAAHSTEAMPAWTAAPAEPVRVAPAQAAQTAVSAKDAPAHPAWRKEIESLIESAQYAKAMDILEPKVKSNEAPAACSNYLGIIAHACGDSELARRHFTDALARSPGDVDVMFNLSDTLLALGRGAEAAKLLEDAAPRTGVESDPGIVDLAATAEQIRHAMARGRIDAENLLASRDANQQAERLLRSGALDEAAKYLDLAMQCDPEDFRALNNLGLLAWYRNDGETAWLRFNQCLAIRPAWTDALINAFDTALAMGDIAAIGPRIDGALAMEPGHAAASSMRRHIQAQGPVIREFRSFEQLETNAALLGKAEQALEKAKQAEAILIYLDAIKLQPQNPQAYNGLGIISFAENRHADAFGLFEAASGLHPLDQDILMNLWQCAQALRREGEVLPRLKQSLERNPDLTDVRAIVKEYA